MTTEANAHARPTCITFGTESMAIDLSDGRRLTTPLSARLWKATTAERNRWVVIGRGDGIRWPDIDEDLSMAGMQRDGVWR